MLTSASHLRQLVTGSPWLRTLIDAIRHVDSAQTVGGVLDRVAEASARVGSRAAVLLFDGGHLRGRRVIGFPMEASTASALWLPLTRTGLIREAVETRSLVTHPRLAEPSGLPDGTIAPPLAPSPDPIEAVAAPLLVGDVVVAVLYADSTRLAVPADSIPWALMIEIIARHGSRTLEVLTARRSAELRRQRVTAGATRFAHAGRELQPMSPPTEYSDRDFWMQRRVHNG